LLAFALSFLAASSIFFNCFFDSFSSPPSAVAAPVTEALADLTSPLPFYCSLASI
jgi:hypothetical protein